ncbi:MAG TPA: HPr family phosphocarrier protein [Anaerohalosphaeraceae bacterium]|nr:HPr family phosphocarrier protein [Anaerohalosphaeraceae bacterium]HPB92346.1 HPr family phosphocarrier protein [Anaerohalosphaeraceae bacterium]HRT22959.1 HPr family phosphocarrier protein [Anaerohalosphaeraceae bacterium]HRU14647.1 HPr family phosphocarrier protein [Anaerohalosphaeraceae bacterium]
MSEQVAETEVEIQNEEGLHLRPAVQFVDVANRYRSTITVSNGTMTADAKSVMEMTMLAATCGSRLKIRACGPDAAEAIAALEELVAKNFALQPKPSQTQKEG